MFCLQLPFVRLIIMWGTLPPVHAKRPRLLYSPWLVGPDWTWLLVWSSKWISSPYHQVRFPWPCPSAHLLPDAYGCMWVLFVDHRSFGISLYEYQVRYLFLCLVAPSRLNQVRLSFFLYESTDASESRPPLGFPWFCGVVLVLPCFLLISLLLVLALFWRNGE